MTNRMHNQDWTGHTTTGLKYKTQTTPKSHTKCYRIPALTDKLTHKSSTTLINTWNNMTNNSWHRTQQQLHIDQHNVCYTHTHTPSVTLHTPSVTLHTHTHAHAHIQFFSLHVGPFPPTVCHREIKHYWRASVASETLTGVKMKKSGMFVCIYVWTYVCHFVLWPSRFCVS